MRAASLFCSAVAAVVVLGVATAGASPTGPFVTGSGWALIPAGQPFGGDRMQVELSARQLPDGSYQGRFDIAHQKADGGLFAQLAGDVTCLRVVGDVAFTTGVITSGKTENGTPVVGSLAAITIVDDPAGEVGFFDATFRFPHEIPPCAAGVLPLAFQGGNLTVHG